jgi:hypothetical protein
MDRALARHPGRGQSPRATARASGDDLNPVRSLFNLAHFARRVPPGARARDARTYIALAREHARVADDRVIVIE